MSSVEPLKKNGEYIPSAEKITPSAPKREEKKHVFGGEGRRVQKLYLRVPSLIGDEFARAKNLVEIFEGATEVIFFDSSNKQYHPSGLGFDATDYTLKQLRDLLGNENVVLK